MTKHKLTVKEMREGMALADEALIYRTKYEMAIERLANYQNKLRLARGLDDSYQLLDWFDGFVSVDGGIANG